MVAPSSERNGVAPSSWLYSVQKNRQGVAVSATFATVIAMPPVTALSSFRSEGRIVQSAVEPPLLHPVLDRPHHLEEQRLVHADGRAVVREERRGAVELVVQRPEESPGGGGLGDVRDGDRDAAGDGAELL